MPRRPAFRRLAAVAAAAALSVPGVASAHPGDSAEAVKAVLVEPRADGVATEQPKTLSVTFNTRINPAGAHELVLLGPGGQRVPTGPLMLPDNGTLRVTMPKLTDRGRYRVQYTVAAQGHLSIGEHTFTYDGQARTTARPSPRWRAAREPCSSWPPGRSPYSAAAAWRGAGG